MADGITEEGGRAGDMQANSDETERPDKSENLRLTYVCVPVAIAFSLLEGRVGSRGRGEGEAGWVGKSNDPVETNDGSQLSGLVNTVQAESRGGPYGSTSSVRVAKCALD